MDKIVLKNKPKLIDWLSGDHDGILQHVQSRGLITNAEYNKMKSISVPRNKVIELLDIIYGKGENVCLGFLNLLKEEDVNEFSPLLRDWIKTVNNSGTPVAQAEEVDAKPPQSRPSVRPSKLKTCSQEFKDNILKEKGEEVYKPLDKFKRKRLALLITNIEFDKEHLYRHGAEKDEDNMEWLLRQLGYDVDKHRNLSGNEMDEVVRNFAKREEHENSDSTFVVIMSHGIRDAILGVHYDKTTNNIDIFPVDKIYKHLNSVNCPALLNKPKVVLIQACREEEDGVLISDKNPDKYVHKEKDFISLMSCTPDTVSYRHPVDGTFYVQWIVHVFVESAHEDDIEELFRKVMRCFELDKRLTKEHKQMVCKDRTTLAKRFYLFPGL